MVVILCNVLMTGQQVYNVRRRCGRQLAIEAPVEADIISTIPESATPAALGFSQQVTVILCSGYNYRGSGDLHLNFSYFTEYPLPPVSDSPFCFFSLILVVCLKKEDI